MLHFGLRRKEEMFVGRKQGLNDDFCSAMNRLVVL